MLKHHRGAALGLLCLTTAIWGQTPQPQAAKPKPPQLSAKVRQQILELLQSKQNRTLAERKIGTDLALALKAARGTRLTPSLNKIDRPLRRVGTAQLNGQVTVSIKGIISPDLTAAVRKSGGAVLHSSVAARTMRARLPLSAVEVLAKRTDVTKIQLPPVARNSGLLARAQLHQLPALGLFRPGESLAFPIPRTGLLATQGIISHRAREVHTNLGVLGAGVNVGVLSDSVDFLEPLIATGDLNPNTVVLPGQSGNPGSSEGSAMMEIIQDLAPAARLFFATAFNGPEGFADNIRALRDAGCHIILDDVSYFPMSPFQDTVIAQAVNDVASTGVLYLSSAGNDGNLTLDTSGTWEGDPEVVDMLGPWEVVHINVLLAQGAMVTLAWADPNGASANDYDLVILDPTATEILDLSLETQDGTQDPVEGAGFSVDLPPGSIIYALRFLGESRGLNLGTVGGALFDGTAGAVNGQAGSENALAVAAVNWNAARRGTRPFTGGPSNPIELFSSDGPRRIFYETAGAPITPGNFLFATNGGRLIQKPDLAAADGNTCVTPPSFSPFFGTSAAVPHAGAIAALVKSAKPNLTGPQIKQILLNSTLDNMAPGIDRDSGTGIVMALPAVQSALGR